MLSNFFLRLKLGVLVVVVAKFNASFAWLSYNGNGIIFALYGELIVSSVQLLRNVRSKAGFTLETFALYGGLIVGQAINFPYRGNQKFSVVSTSHRGIQK